MLELFTDTMMPGTRVLMGMTKRGIPVDIPHLQQWYSKLGDKLQVLLTQWHRHTDVNPNSPSQLKKLIYDTWGLPQQRNKNGAVTTDEGAIKKLLGKEHDHHEALQLLLDIREYAKLTSTYGNREVSETGCVHPHYLPASKDSDNVGAATGRLASSDPNIQNVPMDARTIFIPREGMVFLEADYSQIELRIAAALSGDTGLLNALASGDVHATFMRLLETSNRTVAKGAVYGTIFDESPQGLAADLRKKGVKISVAECRALQRKLTHEAPQLAAWKERLKMEAETNGYLTNPFKRRRYFYAKRGTQIVNYLPQSTAADILWASLVPLEMACTKLGGSLVTTVHDSVLVECPSELSSKMRISLRDVMERSWPQIAHNFKVPITIKQGANWGEMK
jgi:DNA polymerase-1